MRWRARRTPSRQPLRRSARVCSASGSSADASSRLGRRRTPPAPPRHADGRLVPLLLLLDRLAAEPDHASRLLPRSSAPPTSRTRAPRRKSFVVSSPLTEHLDVHGELPDQPGCLERLGRHLASRPRSAARGLRRSRAGCTCGTARSASRPPRCCPRSLPSAHVDRHLAALEAGGHLVRPGARLLALDPTPRVATLARAEASPDALAVLARLRGLQVREIQALRHRFRPSPRRGRGGSTWRSIPRNCGVSSCSADRPILPRPRARSVPSCRYDCPTSLRTWATLTELIDEPSSASAAAASALSSAAAAAASSASGSAAGGGRHGQYLRDRLPAELRNVLGAHETSEAVHGRTRHVDRRRRAEALGEHVADSGKLEHGADAAAGDHARSFARRPEDDASGVEPTDDLVRDRLPVLRHGEEVLLRVLDGLRDRERHLARLSVAQPDAIDLVADDDERGEREAPAALDDLGDAVDLDHALLELAGLCDVHRAQN